MGTMDEQSKEVGDAVQFTEYFIFEISGDHYAVAANLVDQVMKTPLITVVPNAPSSILGIFHFRAKVVVVLDLNRRMNLPQDTSSLKGGFIFVTHHERNYYAIAIDKAVTVTRRSTQEILPVDPLIAAHVPPQYVSGMFMHVSDGRSGGQPEKSILIVPSGAPLTKEEATARFHPVLLLDLGVLLDQADLENIFMRTEGEGGTLAAS